MLLREIHEFKIGPTERGLAHKLGHKGREFAATGGGDVVGGTPEHVSLELEPDEFSEPVTAHTHMVPKDAFGGEGRYVFPSGEDIIAAQQLFANSLKAGTKADGLRHEIFPDDPDNYPFMTILMPNNRFDPNRKINVGQYNSFMKNGNFDSAMAFLVKNGFNKQTISFP
jgi:hypothetical protein